MIKTLCLATTALVLTMPLASAQHALTGPEVVKALGYNPATAAAAAAAMAAAQAAQATASAAVTPAQMQAAITAALSGVSLTSPTTTPTTTPATSTFAFDTSALPGAYMVIDPAQPVQAAALTAGTAGMQVDSTTGKVSAIIDPVSKISMTNGYGWLTYHKDGGPGGKPYLASDPANSLNYDSLIMPGSAANAMFGAALQPWTLVMVVRQHNTSQPNDIIVNQTGSGNASVFGISSTTGQLRFEQNNGSAGGNEDASKVPALGTWHVLTVAVNGQTASIYRNATRSLLSASGNIGGLSGSTKFEMLNNGQADIAYARLYTSSPTISQLNTELQRLATKFSLTGVGTVTEGDTTQHDTATVDLTAVNQITTQNFPISDTLPQIAGSVPADGVTLASGATPVFDLKFGTGAGNNVTTGQKIRDLFYLNYFTGDASKAIGAPMDTAQNPSSPVFHAVARHYPAGDANDLHTIDATGMKLAAICGGNHQDCSVGHVWAAMTRLPTVFSPGMTIEVDYKTGKGANLWAPIWLISGVQKTPGPGGNPYQGFDYATGAGLIHGSGTHTYEIDLNDNYPRVASGTAVGKQLDFGTPDIYGTPRNVAPHGLYVADGTATEGTYKFHPGAGPDYEELAQDCSATVCRMILDWRTDSTMNLLINGKVVWSHYMEYTPDTYTDSTDGLVKPVGTHLILGNQAIPNFAPGAATAVENDGLPDGWSLWIQRVAAWNGNVANPDSLRATTTSGIVSAFASFAQGSAPAATISGAPFYWFNQSNATIAPSTISGATVTAPASGENVVGIVTPITAEMSTIKLRYDGPSGVDYFNFGLLAATTGSPNALNVAMITPQTTGAKYNQNFVTTVPGGARTINFTGTDAIANQVKNGQAYCLRLDKSSATGAVWFSPTCAAGSFVQMFTASLSDLNSPGYIGAYINSNGQSSSPGTMTLLGYSAVASTDAQAVGP